MNVKVLSSLDVEAKIKTKFPENSPWGLRKTHIHQTSFNFRPGNFWNFNKILNVIKNINTYTFV